MTLTPTRPDRADGHSDGPESAAAARLPRGRAAAAWAFAVAALVGLGAASIAIGVADLSWDIVLISRLPRTAALILAGASLAVAGLVMQLLTRNPFVEPSTAGTMEFAVAGLLVVTIIAPGAPVVVKMLCAAAAAMAGTGVFLAILERIRFQDILVVPLVGLMLGGIVAAATTFVAYRFDLIQGMGAWTTSDFSATIAGRYEILWIAGGVTLATIMLADRLTIAGLGDTIATNLGLDHRRTMALGMGIVSIVAAVVVATVGMLPFIGLVAPNVVALVLGANARRSIPWVALGGALLVLACDLLARTVVFPFELPIGTILGVLGGIAFLVLLLTRSSRAA